MKQKTLFFPYLVLLLVFACRNKEELKVVSRYSNGNVQETHTYTSPTDTLSFLDTKYHENGKILYQGRFEKGKQEGWWVWYFSNGVLRDSANYSKGEFTDKRVHWDSLGRLTSVEIINGPCYDCCCDGEVISYYPNGKPESEVHMYKGKEHGKYVYYYDNGQPKKEQYLVEGVKDGNYYEWYRNGTRWVTGFYKDGKMDSIWTWFDTTGKVESVQVMRDGELIRESN